MAQKKACILGKIQAKLDNQLKWGVAIPTILLGLIFRLIGNKFQIRELHIKLQLE